MAGRLSIFIGIDILVLISEFVVVAILSEWWSLPTTVGTSLGVGRHILRHSKEERYI